MKKKSDWFWIGGMIVVFLVVFFGIRHMDAVSKGETPEQIKTREQIHKDAEQTFKSYSEKGDSIEKWQNEILQESIKRMSEDASN